MQMSEQTGSGTGAQGNENWVQPKGVYLPKGYIGENNINNLQYPIGLNNEERQTIQRQWKYLCCTITGANFRSTILGLGLRVYPRQMSEAEKKRQAEDAKNATASTSSVYNVYPTVRPPTETIRPINWKDNPRMGRVEIVVGPYISIEAYNNGASGNTELNILPANQRGVVDYDQQYNAVNLQVFVPTIDGTKRQGITNRLSFYINREHGSRVFPLNIESQMSLMLYRTSDKYQGYNGKGLIPRDFKTVFPRILKETIHELLTGKNEIDYTRLDHVMRTYFLVHQVSVHFVIEPRYRYVYDYLYRTVIEFSQAPVQRRELFHDLEEFLITSHLVNIRWETIKYAFIHGLFRHFMDATDGMNSEAPIEKKIRHIFNQNRRLITSVLLIWSFQVSSGASSLVDLVNKYDRLWGTLPDGEINEKKEMINAVKTCRSMADFWRMIGMASPDKTDHEVNKKIYEYFERMTRIRYSEAPPTGHIRIPDVAQGPNTVQSSGIIDFHQRREDMMRRRLEEEQKKHEGMPTCDENGMLPRDQCAYPLCGKKFASRSELFEHHLNMAVADMRKNYHRIHQNFISGKTEEDLRTLLEISPERGNYKCPICGDTFDQQWKLYKHYADFRFPGNWQSRVPTGTSTTVSTGDSSNTIDEDGDICVICMDAKRNATFVPCGHLATCYNCGQNVNMCPICRGPFRQVLKVYFV